MDATAQEPATAPARIHRRFGVRSKIAAGVAAVAIVGGGTA